MPSIKCISENLIFLQILNRVIFDAVWFDSFVLRLLPSNLIFLTSFKTLSYVMMAVPKCPLFSFRNASANSSPGTLFFCRATRRNKKMIISDNIIITENTVIIFISRIMKSQYKDEFFCACYCYIIQIKSYIIPTRIKSNFPGIFNNQE